MTKITKENMQNAHDELLQTFVDKNADYGNSFESSLEEYGLIAALIRMDDKMGRLRTLIKSEAKVKDESISDTLRDLSNYALMASVWVDNKTITQEVSEAINRIKKLTFDPIKAFTDEAVPSKEIRKEGYYSGIRVFKSGEHCAEPDGEIEIQNKEQLRLFLNIHKDAGAHGLVKAIGRDIFYLIDFTEFYRYIKELRGVSFDESEKFEIYFNIRNDKLNKKIYVRTNDVYSTYVFYNTKEFETAINQFIDYKKHLLDKAPNPRNIKSLIQVEVDRQDSNILKPRVRIDDAFVKLMLWYDEVNYSFHREDVKSFLNSQFIYDMYEGATNPDHGRYHLVINDDKLIMASSVEAALKTFLSNSFLDSFQSVLDSGRKVKLVKAPQ
jgi:hypothetical protein